MAETQFKFNEEVIVPGSYNVGCSQDYPAKVVKDDGGHAVFVRMLARCCDCDCCEEFRYMKRDKLVRKEASNG